MQIMAQKPQLAYNSIIQPLLTDLYEITMAYAYWKSGKINDHAVFDLFFRKNPFGGEFTVFAGLEECLKFLQRFHFSDSDIEYLKRTLPRGTEDEFFEYLRNLKLDNVTLYALDEGTVAFPRVPLLRVEGPLVVTQMLETTLLTLVNYASLITTNAARFRLAAGQDVSLLEFGLRRAQGPDGGLSASKYAYIGGFDGTSNVLAGKLFNIPVKGTHAHAFVTSFTGFAELEPKMIKSQDGSREINLLEAALAWRKKLVPIFKVIESQVNDGELASFISYGHAFPSGFLALIDTYDVVKSGLVNFCAVALALSEIGYRAIGIRLDSGDLAYLSIVTRRFFAKIGEKFSIPWFKDLTIVASNDINEETILSINDQGHEINCYGVGTHLVTCQKQPALGGVYKLVEVNGMPRMKLSQDVEKVTIPGRKNAYRLFNKEGHALIDLMLKYDEPPPKPEAKVLCRHAFLESKRAYVYPHKVEPLHKVYWQDGKICRPLPNMQEMQNRVRESLNTLRPDIKRSLNPTPYKVSVSMELFNFIHELWLENAPIGELF